MFATEASLGVHMAKSYKFVIITTPVGAYYAEGINPVKILVEDEYVRAVKRWHRIYKMRRSTMQVPSQAR